jgi:F0F1-type ATP synthase alpha subunit
VDVPVCSNLLGHVVNTLGNPINSNGPIAAADCHHEGTWYPSAGEGSKSCCKQMQMVEKEICYAE